ncbi:MAG: type IV pilus secretin PilQ [gamma proteobacterium symbiont of Taylorina sp.]|nr:type IV pilus secretin PilQ [gamma proteobacterium symbiont of Taylorina sp.]
MNKKIMTQQLSAMALWILSSCIVTICFASAAHARNQLEDISFASIPGNKVQVVLHFSAAAPNPKVFTIDTPARIALDLPDTELALAKKRHKIGIGLVRSIASVSSGERSRVVLNLVSLTSYATKVNGNDIIITLNEGSGGSPIVSSGQSIIKNIDFRLGGDNEGNIILTFSEQPNNVNMKQEFEKLVVEIEGVSLPGDLERRLDVKDFNTPVSFVDTFTSGKKIKMLIETKGEFEHLGYQSGKTFTIEVKGLTKEEKQARQKAKFGFTGEKLSLNFQDIEVRAVLQLIADFTGKNMVTSDTVNGSITLRLKNVPWDQALDIILKTKGLGMREEGNVMRVAPAEELAAIEKQELESKKQIADLAPRITETIQLQYVPATTVVDLLSQLAEDGGRNNKNTAGDSDAGATGVEGAAFSSLRVKIVGDDRTNKLIINAPAYNIAQIRKLIEEIDTPTQQVLIDSRVVIATDTFTKDLGLNWSYFKANDGNVVGTNVDLGNPAKNVLAMTFGLLNDNYLLGLEISASQVENNIEVISSPRVVTTNGTPATIKSGTQIPYQTVSDNTVTTEFKDAVLSLQVTPLIIPGNKVNMALKINKDSPGAEYNGETGIDTREIQTSVLVDNGDTVVLGGIYESNHTESVDGIPVLGDIPVIGQAFRVNSNKTAKQELIIFITPKIMNETLSVR